ncbi:hypothetical protein L218DRAFT_940468 [Marasmius fiardii PR-910]|nr:hypothetical protein L218DRAFT_940468 [Marasmius fiardii PR-910]
MTDFFISPQQKESFEKDGFLVLPAVSEGISKDIVEWTYEVKNLPHRSDAWMHYEEISSQGFRTLTRTENFANFHQGFNGLFRGKVILDILKQLSGEEMVLFKEKINYKAGSVGRWLSPAYNHIAKVKHLSGSVSSPPVHYGELIHNLVLMAVEPATLENGCLEVVAGSHKLIDSPSPIPVGSDQCIEDDWCSKQTWTPVPLETGQFLIFGSYLAHRSAANNSANGRAAIYATYNALSEGGDKHDEYYVNRRQYWPPTADRAPGEKYVLGAKMYGQRDYIGEQVSQLEHSLQAANCARTTTHVGTVVIAALLHDIGHFLPKSTLNMLELPSPASDTDMVSLSNSTIKLGRTGHETIGATYLSSLGFPGIVCDLVGAHVVAKRYLTATEGEYWDSLSDASKASLEVQGGPFPPSEAEEFKKDPLFQEKVAMRRFDDYAKVVGLEVPEIEEYKEMAVRILLGAGGQ